MNNLNKYQAIAIGLITLALVLMMGSMLMDSRAEVKKTEAEKYALEHAAPAMAVDPEPEFNVELNCPDHRNDFAMSKYEEIPGACFEYFHITDAMMEARMRSLYPYENPCSN